jgi:hypothetical protein
LHFVARWSGYNKPTQHQTFLISDFRLPIADCFLGKSKMENRKSAIENSVVLGGLHETTQSSSSWRNHRLLSVDFSHGSKRG